MIPKVGQKFMVFDNSPEYNPIELLTFTCVKVDDQHVYGVHEDQKLRFSFSGWKFRPASFSYTFTFNPAPTQSSKIPPEMLKILIMLCHPDKHNNSPASTKAIKYLLEQR